MCKGPSFEIVVHGGRTTLTERDIIRIRGGGNHQGGGGGGQLGRPGRGKKESEEGFYYRRGGGGGGKGGGRGEGGGGSRIQFHDQVPTRVRSCTPRMMPGKTDFRRQATSGFQRTQPLQSKRSLRGGLAN